MILTFHRDIGDGLWEMTTTLSIQADLLKDTGSIPYKYVVLTDNIISEFEFLHGAPNKGHFVNRCLIIPTASFRRGGMGCIHSNMLHMVIYACTYSFAILCVHILCWPLIDIEY